MISAVLAALVLFADTTTALQATPAASTPTSQASATAAPAKAKAPDNPNAMVCKSEPVLGSRLPAKRCHTQGDLAQQKIQDRQDIERAQIRTDNGH